MKKIILIIDALRFDKDFYFKKNLLADEIYSINLIPPFCFEPDAAFLTGKYPQESNNGLKIMLNDVCIKNKILNFLMPFVPQNNYALRKLFNKIVCKAKFLPNLRIKGSISFIPFNMIYCFNSTDVHSLYKGKNQNQFKTIFNKLEEKNIKHSHIGAPLTSGKLENIKKRFNFNDFDQNDVVSFFINDLDEIGHYHTANSDAYNNKLIEIINFINSLFTYLKAKNENFDFVIFGDHGMVEIEKSIDVNKIIKKLPFKPFDDYIMFLDSTLARFWFKNEKTRIAITQALPNNEAGCWINKNDRGLYKINYSHNKFGDEIWWANKGYLISPNYWEGNVKVKAMHGYRNEVEENHTCLISNVNYYNDAQSIDMISLYKTLCSFLNI